MDIVACRRPYERGLERLLLLTWTLLLVDDLVNKNYITLATADVDVVYNCRRPREQGLERLLL